jgi:cysteine sulfinate desulfinase/cysteine desulfurase-like protein
MQGYGALHGKGQKMTKGLYANIAAKRRRIKQGSNEKMRKPGTKGAPTAAAFKAAAKTAKKTK